MSADLRGGSGGASGSGDQPAARPPDRERATVRPRPADHPRLSDGSRPPGHVDGLGARQGLYTAWWGDRDQPGGAAAARRPAGPADAPLAMRDDQRPTPGDPREQARERDTADHGDAAGAAETDQLRRLAADLAADKRTWEAERAAWQRERDDLRADKADLQADKTAYRDIIADLRRDNAAKDTRERALLEKLSERDATISQRDARIEHLERQLANRTTAPADRQDKPKPDAQPPPDTRREPPAGATGQPAGGIAKRDVPLPSESVRRDDAVRGRFRLPGDKATGAIVGNVAAVIGIAQIGHQISGDAGGATMLVVGAVTSTLLWVKEIRNKGKGKDKNAD